VPPDDAEHSNVIAVLPVQSRDHLQTGSAASRTRREAAMEDQRRFRGQRLSSQRSAGHRSRDSTASILVSHYVTGKYIIQGGRKLNLLFQLSQNIEHVV